VRLKTLLRGISNKRELLAKALKHSGILALVEHTRSAWRPGLVVFTYHRIADPFTDHFYDPVISATPKSFRTQIKWLHSRFQIVALDELLSRLQAASPWRELVVLLTFDDGYRDNFDIAVPILREHGVPATFFIPTAFLESPQLPWWDHIAYVIKKTTAQRLTLEMAPGSIMEPLKINIDPTQRSVAIMAIVRAFLDGTVIDESWFLNQLEVQAGVTVDSATLGRTLFMSWDQVGQLAGAGLTIGSHAHTHRKLAGLDEQSQLFELTESRRVLKQRLNREIRALAYPYGWPGTFSPRTRSLAAETGYDIAFGSQVGVNRYGKIDLFEVKRLGIGWADSTALLRARTALQVAFGNSFL
jgi:peptidoglycan/xylan/chitin deacetylase (PgdA/CDA1 family)